MKSNKQKRVEEKIGLMVMLLAIFVSIGGVAIPLDLVVRLAVSIGLFILGAIMWMGEDG